jgi:hypothetical protein
VEVGLGLMGPSFTLLHQSACRLMLAQGPPLQASTALESSVVDTSQKKIYDNASFVAVTLRQSLHRPWYAMDTRSPEKDHHIYRTTYTAYVCILYAEPIPGHPNCHDLVMR